MDERTRSDIRTQREAIQGLEREMNALRPLMRTAVRAPRLETTTAIWLRLAALEEGVRAVAARLARAGASRP